MRVKLQRTARLINPSVPSPIRTHMHAHMQTYAHTRLCIHTYTYIYYIYYRGIKSQIYEWIRAVHGLAFMRPL